MFLAKLFRPRATPTKETPAANAGPTNTSATAARKPRPGSDPHTPIKGANSPLPQHTPKSVLSDETEEEGTPQVKGTNLFGAGEATPVRGREPLTPERTFGASLKTGEQLEIGVSLSGVRISLAGTEEVLQEHALDVISGWLSRGDQFFYQVQMGDMDTQNYGFMSDHSEEICSVLEYMANKVIAREGIVEPTGTEGADAGNNNTQDSLSPVMAEKLFRPDSTRKSLYSSRHQIEYNASYSVTRAGERLQLLVGPGGLLAERVTRAQEVSLSHDFSEITGWVSLPTGLAVKITKGLSSTYLEFLTDSADPICQELDACRPVGRGPALVARTLDELRGNVLTREDGEEILEHRFDASRKGGRGVQVVVNKNGITLWDDIDVVEESYHSFDEVEGWVASAGDFIYQVETNDGGKENFTLKSVFNAEICAAIDYICAKLAHNGQDPSPDNSPGLGGSKPGDGIVETVELTGSMEEMGHGTHGDSARGRHAASNEDGAAGGIDSKLDSIIAQEVEEKLSRAESPIYGGAQGQVNNLGGSDPLAMTVTDNGNSGENPISKAMAFLKNIDNSNFDSTAGSLDLNSSMGSLGISDIEPSQQRRASRIPSPSPKRTVRHARKESVQQARAATPTQIPEPASPTQDKVGFATRLGRMMFSKKKTPVGKGASDEPLASIPGASPSPRKSLRADQVNPETRIPSPSPERRSVSPRPREDPRARSATPTRIPSPSPRRASPSRSPRFRSLSDEEDRAQETSRPQSRMDDNMSVLSNLSMLSKSPEERRVHKAEQSLNGSINADIWGIRPKTIPKEVFSHKVDDAASHNVSQMLSSVSPPHDRRPVFPQDASLQGAALNTSVRPLLAKQKNVRETSLSPARVPKGRMTPGGGHMGPESQQLSMASLHEGSVVVEPDALKLRVTLVQGSHLIPQNKMLMGSRFVQDIKSWPMVEMTAGGDTRKSTVKHGVKKPRWNEKFEYEALTSASNLDIVVTDVEIPTFAVEVGRVRIPLSSLPHDGTEVTLWYPLYTRKKPGSQFGASVCLEGVEACVGTQPQVKLVLSCDKNFDADIEEVVQHEASMASVCSSPTRNVTPVKEMMSWRRSPSPGGRRSMSPPKSPIQGLRELIPTFRNSPEREKSPVDKFIKPESFHLDSDGWKRQVDNKTGRDNMGHKFMQARPESPQRGRTTGRKRDSVVHQASSVFPSPSPGPMPTPFTASDSMRSLRTPESTPRIGRATPNTSQDRIVSDDGWARVRDPASGRHYYYNMESRVTTWKCPPSLKEYDEGHVSGLDLVNQSQGAQGKTTDAETSTAAQEVANRPASKKPEWRKVTDPKSGRPYYYNRLTRATTWKKPAEYSDPNETEGASIEDSAAATTNDDAPAKKPEKAQPNVLDDSSLSTVDVVQVKEHKRVRRLPTAFIPDEMVQKKKKPFGVEEKDKEMEMLSTGLSSTLGTYSSVDSKRPEDFDYKDFIQEKPGGGGGAPLSPRVLVRRISQEGQQHHRPMLHKSLNEQRMIAAEIDAADDELSEKWSTMSTADLMSTLSSTAPKYDPRDEVMSEGARANPSSRKDARDHIVSRMKYRIDMQRQSLVEEEHTKLVHETKRREALVKVIEDQHKIGLGIRKSLTPKHNNADIPRTPAQTPSTVRGTPASGRSISTGRAMDGSVGRGPSFRNRSASPGVRSAGVANATGKSPLMRGNPSVQPSPAPAPSRGRTPTPKRKYLTRQEENAMKSESVAEMIERRRRAVEAANSRSRTDVQRWAKRNASPLPRPYTPHE